MAKRRNYRPLIALVALAAAALVTATLTFTNITIWVINATLPPAMKYAGPDTTITGRADGSGYDRYVYVTSYYDSNTGYNITRISIVGFTGDPTNYTRVMQVCNRYYKGNLYVRLVAVKALDGKALSAIRDFRVYFSDPASVTGGGNYVQFVGDNVIVKYTGYTTLSQGSCATIGAYVVVDPATVSARYRDGKTVIARYEVHVQFATDANFASPPP